MEKSAILNKIKEAKEKSKPRKFIQAWDLSVVVKGINLKKPENSFSSDFILPHGRGKDIKLAVIADKLVPEAKGKAELIIKKDEIEKLAKDRKKLKRIVNNYTLLGEVSLMPQIGKHWGRVLGPRGKVPKPIPPNVKLEPFLQIAKKNIRIVLKGNPVINAVVGSDDMPDESVAANVIAVYNFIKEKLPKGIGNIRVARIKLTMGKPAKLEVR